jgi:hypothetical protein
VVQLLQNLDSYGLNLEDVEKSISTQEKLKSLNVSLEGIIDVLFAAESSSMDMADLVHLHKTFKEQGLSPEKVSDVLEAKQNFEAIGLGLDSQVSLYEASKVYGDPQSVFEAIAEYGSLLGIKAQVKAAEEGLEKVKAAKADQDNQIKDGKEKLLELATSIEAHKKVAQLGYDEQTLVDLAGLSEQFGGPKAVIQSCKAYADYKHIEENIINAKNSLADINSEISQLRSEHGYLATGINICEKLVKEYGFGLDSIDTLLSVAKKYGDPLQVLRAIDTLKINIAQLNGKYEATMEKLRSLNALALQVGDEVANVHCQAADNVYMHQLLELINDPYSADYGPHINAAMIGGRALKAYVIKYESNFKHRAPIINGLTYLIADLGGVSDITG